MLMVVLVIICALVLDLYHSCSITQPLLLDWLHGYGCPISEGKLNNLLVHGHEPFHLEREEILETGISCSLHVLVLRKPPSGKTHSGQQVGTGSPGLDRKAILVSL